MGDLKTLKEIGCQKYMTPIGGKREQVGNNCLITVGDLKQEAIKWAKDLNKETQDLRPHNLDNYHEKLTGLCATLEWIIMFFNITNKDLK